VLHFVLYLFSFLDDHLSLETDFASGFKTNIYQKFKKNANKRKEKTVAFDLK